MESLLIATRGSDGLNLLSCNNSSTPRSVLRVPNVSANQYCRVSEFCYDGSMLAYCNGSSTSVLDVTSLKSVHQFDLPKTSHLHWSPRGSVLCTYEQYTVQKDETEGRPNLRLWNVESGALVAQFVQKRQQGWSPQWNSNESIAARVTGSEIMFYERNSFDRYINKLVLKNVADYCLSPSATPCHVSCYVPGQKGQPCSIRIFQYPAFQDAVSTKSFYKADRVQMKWNNRGTALLVMAIADVDQTGASYYGEQSLYLMLTNGEGCRMELGKEGPIYCFEWNPNSNEFCVVYGFMPAKATLYNLKGESTFDFGTAPRNEAHYNAFGNILCLAGFGNLRGQMEFWALANAKQSPRRVNHLQAEDTTVFRWAPDGTHFLTATTAPRLRVNNGYKLWYYGGRVVLKECVLPQGQELWEATWRPAAEGVFVERPVSEEPVSPGGRPVVAADQVPKVVAYVPPHLRGKPQHAFKIREEEPPENERDQKANENLSKNALKNRKKREAAKKTKDVGDAEAADGSVAVPVQYNSSLPVTSGAKKNDPEKEKKMRSITKKLEQIAQLKMQVAQGKTLEINQMDKIKKEDQLIAELEDLKLS